MLPGCDPVAAALTAPGATAVMAAAEVATIDATLADTEAFCAEPHAA